MSCAYADHNEQNRASRARTGAVACSGPVIFTAHDGRGCRDVCFSHAQWLMTHSITPGHGSRCPMKGRRR